MAEYECRPKSSKYIQSRVTNHNYLEVPGEDNWNTQKNEDEVSQRPRAFSLHSGLRRSSFQNTFVKDRRHSVAVDVAKGRDHGYMDRNADSVAHCLFEAMQLAKDDHEHVDKLRHRRTRSYKDKPERRDDDDNLFRVRSFKTSSKGLVGKTETVCHVVTDKDLSSIERNNPSIPDTQGIPKVAVNMADDRVNYYRVIALGTEGVGKTSIIDLFMASDFSESKAVNTSKSDDRSVTLEVDGEETVLEFLQAEDFQESEENLSLNGFLVVYATTDRRSFDRAVEVLKHLRDEVGHHKAVILVGNKTDLVRHRHVTTEEGRRIADKYGCKYIETSASLNLQVDELLVGICKQIALKNDHTLTADSRNEDHGYDQRRSSFHKARRFLQKVFHIHSNKEKSTENLYVD